MEKILMLQYQSAFSTKFTFNILEYMIFINAHHFICYIKMYVT